MPFSPGTVLERVFLSLRQWRGPACLSSAQCGSHRLATYGTRETLPMLPTATRTLVDLEFCGLLCTRLALTDQDSGLDGELNQLRGGRQIQFFHHAVFMECDGPRRYFQNAGHLFHGLPFR